MVKIEERRLSAFEQHTLADVQRFVQLPDGVGNVLLHARRHVLEQIVTEQVRVDTFVVIDRPQ